MKTHLCVAEGCLRRVKTTMLMCRKHWRRLPKPIQEEVWKHYKPDTHTATQEYRRAHRDAVDMARRNFHDKDRLGVLRIVSVAEFMAEFEGMPEREKWLVDGLLTAGGNGLFVAEEKFGKTWTSIFLALAVASGKPFLGKYPVSGQGPVFLHCPARDPLRFQDQLKNAAAIMGVRLKEIPLTVSTQPRLHLDNPEHQAMIEEQHQKEQFALQVFSSFETSLANRETLRKATHFLEHLIHEYDITNFVTRQDRCATEHDHYADDVWEGEKIGQFGREITFQQRHAAEHEPIRFLLPKQENMPMKFKLVSSVVSPDIA